MPGSASTTRPTARAGASIAADAEEIFSLAEMIVKVKEPVPAEYRLLREEQILFTYLHLAADRAQTEGCSSPAASRSPTRRSPTATAACRCWRR